jgi:hypothetical protein
VHDFAPFLVPITLFVTIGAVAILRGPLGKAMGERIGGGSRDVDAGPEVEHLRAELDEVRMRLTDVEERLDFTERVLASERERGRLTRGED